MIKHIVCWKLDDESRKKETKDLLLSMQGKCPQIIAIEVGCDFLQSPRSYDVILQVTVKDKQALTDYQQDQYHCEKIKPYMHAHTTAAVAVDYEL